MPRLHRGRTFNSGGAGVTLDAPAAAPAAAAPTVVSVATTNESQEIAATFSESVTGNLSAGVKIIVNGAETAIEDASPNGNIVVYSISYLIFSGDVVTWEYSQAAGSLVSVATGVELEETPPTPVVIS